MESDKRTYNNKVMFIATFGFFILCMGLFSAFKGDVYSGFIFMLIGFGFLIFANSLRK